MSDTLEVIARTSGGSRESRRLRRTKVMLRQGVDVGQDTVQLGRETCRFLLGKRKPRQFGDVVDVDRMCCRHG